jgi:hypothetical protein
MVPDDLTTDEQAYLARLYHACPQVAVAEALVEEFGAVLRERDVEAPSRKQTVYDAQTARAEKVVAALATLEEGIAVLTDSERFKTYLATMSCFHDYSFNNILLVQMQRPDATMVAGSRKWQSMERSVRRGEKGIAIIYPTFKITNENDEEHRVLAGYGLGYVFGIAQTLA